MKHSVVLFLSPIWTQDENPEEQDNFVHKQYTNTIDGQEVDCIQTNESAVRYIQARLEEQEESISKIYILASKKVKKRKSFLYKGKECMELLESMKAFSIAVSLCIPYEMVKAIKELRDAIETFKQAPYMSVKEEAFKYTVNTVEQEYTTLLSVVNDDLKLKLSIIRWCIDKGLLQQALTLSTEWLASILFDTHIYYHKNLDSIKGLLQNDVRKLKRSYEESFVMSYTKKDSTLPDKFSKEYKHKIDVSVPKNIIKFLRTNIGSVKTKNDIDELLQGLDIEKSKIYELIYQCIEAKRWNGTLTVIEKLEEYYGRNNI